METNSFINSYFKDKLVIDLSSVLAGPAVAMFFAELGARVIKIENKTTGGDVTRNWKLSTESSDELSAYYKSINWGKEILFLDLNTELESIFSLINNADILVTNLKPNSLISFGLDYDSLKKLNPKLIYAHLTSYDDGDERPAFDVALQAETGYISMSGTDEDNLTKMPVALIDVIAAHQLKEGILIGLLKREKTGEGCYLTASLYGAAISSLANQASSYLNEGYIPKPMATLHPNIAPYGDIFTTKDGIKIIFAIGTEKQFVSLCKILKINEKELLTFNTNVNRVKNRKELVAKIQAKIDALNADFIIEECTKFSVPVSMIQNLENVFKNKYSKKYILNYPKNEQNKSSSVVKTFVVSFG